MGVIQVLINHTNHHLNISIYFILRHFLFSSCGWIHANQIQLISVSVVYETFNKKILKTNFLLTIYIHIGQS